MLSELFAAVLVISSNGSVSTALLNRTLPAPVCDVVRAKFFTADQTYNVNGQQVTVRFRSVCVPLDGAGPMAQAPQGMPPELMDMFSGFMRGIPR